MTHVLETIIDRCRHGLFAFSIPAAEIITADQQLLDANVLTPASEKIAIIPAPCGCSTMLKVAYDRDGEPFVVCPECDEYTTVNPKDLLQYKFNLINIGNWYQSVHANLSRSENNTILEVFGSYISSSAKTSSPPTKQMRGRPRKYKADSARCGRFSLNHPTNPSCIIDLDHTPQNGYNDLTPYDHFNANTVPGKIILQLIKAMDKKGGWVQSESNWHNAFKQPTYHRFKREQIMIGKQQTSLNGHWRIIPNELFDIESKLGKARRMSKKQT